MPRVPEAPETVSPILTERPTPTNLLMAAATMHSMGRLTEPEPAPSKKIRPLKRKK